MCSYFSICINKPATKILGDGSLDSHTELYKNAGIEEEKSKEDLLLLKWARIEITPKDGDIFNHDLKNWELKIDEQRKPDWFGPKHEKVCFAALEKSFKKHFLIGGEYDVLPHEGIRFLKDVKIKILREKIEVLDGGTVQKVLGGTVQKVFSDGTVQEVWGGGTVQKVLGGTVIVYFSERAFLSLKEIKNGNNVLIKRWLQNVEVEIK